MLLSLYPWWQYGWSTPTFYGGLALMLAAALWDLAFPAHRRCELAPGSRQHRAQDRRAA